MPFTRLPRRTADSRRPRRERGAAAVEFALVMIPLITLLLGSIQFGFYFFSAQSASSAGRETARRLVVGDCLETPLTAQTFAQNQANVLNLTLTYGPPDSSGPTAISAPGTMPAIGQPVRVVVSADADIIHFFPLPNSGKVTRVVNARVEDTEMGAPCS